MNEALLMELIAEAEKDIAEGRTQPVREFFKEFKKRIMLKPENEKSSHD